MSYHPTGHHSTDPATTGEVTPATLEHADNDWDSAEWVARKTFFDMYLDGDLPWPEEPLLQNDRHPFEVVDEYVSLLAAYSQAERNSDSLSVRRLTGELNAADAGLSDMDTCDRAAVLTRLTDHLTHAVQHPEPVEVTQPQREQVLPEQGRFKGPAPYYRRGRAYIQALAPAFTLAVEGHGEFVSRRPDNADQLLRAVEASEDVVELQDFIAGAVHELHRQLRQLISHPITARR